MSFSKPPGIQCPNCGNDESGVIDSRRASGTIRRRRRCVACNTRFTTYEGTDDAYGLSPVVAKSLLDILGTLQDKATHLRSTIERFKTGSSGVSSLDEDTET